MRRRARRWIELMRSAMKSLPYQFSAERMVEDYVEQVYRQASDVTPANHDRLGAFLNAPPGIRAPTANVPSGPFLLVLNRLSGA
jgi:hypothetical protein